MYHKFDITTLTQVSSRACCLNALLLILIMHFSHKIMAIKMAAHIFFVRPKICHLDTERVNAKLYRAEV